MPPHVHKLMKRRPHLVNKEGYLNQRAKYVDESGIRFDASPKLNETKMKLQPSKMSHHFLSNKTANASPNVTLPPPKVVFKESVIPLLESAPRTWRAWLPHRSTDLTEGGITLAGAVRRGDLRTFAGPTVKSQNVSYAYEEPTKKKHTQKKVTQHTLDLLIKNNKTKLNNTQQENFTNNNVTAEEEEEEAELKKLKAPPINFLVRPDMDLNYRLWDTRGTIEKGREENKNLFHFFNRLASVSYPPEYFRVVSQGD